MSMEYWNLTMRFETEDWFQYMGFITAFIYFIFFLIIWNNKELQAHPMKLFMYLSMFECILQFNYSMSSHICQFDMHYLLAYTTKFSAEPIYVVGALERLKNASKIINSFAFLMTVCYSSCICLDLIFTLAYPFQPKEERMVKYNTISATISIVVAILFRFDHQSTIFFLLRICVWAMMTFFVLAAPVSIVYAHCKLKRPGLSQEVRSIIVRRHIYTMVFYLVFNSYQIMNFTILLYPGLIDPRKDGNVLSDKTLPKWVNSLILVSKVLYRV